VGDNHDVAGAIPVIQTLIDRLPHTTVPWRDTILRRSLAEVRILSVVRFLRRRLGRSWIPTPRSSVRFTGDVPFLLLRVVQ
jgi:hypothetical protein